MESVIAERYAVALYQVAREAKALDPVLKEMREVGDLLSANPELREALERPRVDRFEKLAALQAFLKGPLSKTVGNFLLLLMTKKRMAYFASVAGHYEGLCYGEKGKAIARVLTALPLTDGEKKALAGKLGQASGAQIEVREQVDPALIGGMLVYLGDQRMDATFLGRLDKLKHQLMGVDL